MRLFVAAWPPAEVVASLSSLPRPAVPGVRWTAPGQWHATLRFYGSVADEAVDGLMASLAAVPWPLPVQAALGPATACFGRSVLMVPVAGLDRLAALVADAGDPRPFHGHLTLARSRGRRGADLRPFAGAAVAAAWTVSEVALVRSRTLPSGAQYEVLARYPLSNVRSQLR